MDLRTYFEELQEVTDIADTYIQTIKEKVGSKKSEFIDLASSYPQGTLNRKFRTREVSQMIGISESGLYKAEKEGRIPGAHYVENAAGRLIRDGWTIDQLLEIRKAFNKLPSTFNHSKAMTLSFPNLKGGCWKTTLSLLAAQSYALRGYRVLVIDTDAQGTLSFFMGYQPDIDTEYEDTIAPFVLYEEHPEGVYDDLEYAIRPTHWPNIDIIPANLNLSLIDTSLPIALASSETKEEKQHILERLGTGISGISEKYDLIIIDGTPSLNILTISTLMACDHVIVPCPSQMADFASTVQFFNNLKNSVEPFIVGGMSVSFPEYHVLVTKYANAKYSNWMTNIIRKTFNVRALDNVVKKSDEIGKTGTQITTIYEQQPSKVKNRRTLDNAVDMYDEIFNEIEKKIILPYFNDQAVEHISTEEILLEEGVA